MLLRTTAFLIFICVFFPNTTYSQFHATVDGSINGSGTLEDPVDLQTILKDNKNVHAGDTIYVHDGVYTGNFVTYVQGEKDNPVVICPYKNDYVVIDQKTFNPEDKGKAGVSANFSHVQFLGLVFTNSDNTNRSSTSVLPDGYGGTPDDIFHGEAITIQADNVDVINCIFHNIRGEAIGTYRTGGIYYGNLIFHCGFDNIDRGHGHGMYIQNGDVENPKEFENNLIHTGFMYNMKLYSTNGYLEGIDVRDNICFNSAICSKPGDSKDSGRDIFLGGKVPSEYVTIENNYTYKSEWGITINGPGLQIGWRDINKHITVSNNYIVGGNRTLTIMNCDSSSFTNNTFVSRDKEYLDVDPYFRDYMIRYDSIETGLPSLEFDHNNYYTGNNDNQVQIFSHSIPMSEWQTNYFDAGSSWTKGLPNTNIVRVIPNKYEAGRAHVVIYNWEIKNSVSIDLADVLEVGQSYYIYDSQDLFKGALLNGVYSGDDIVVPMHGSDLAIKQPNGENIEHIKHTEKEFGAFLVTPKPLYPDSEIYIGTPITENIGNSNLNVKCWPNPTTDFVEISFNSTNKRTAIKVTDIFGKVLISKDISTEDYKDSNSTANYKLNLVTLPKGYYIILLNDGTVSDSFKLLKI